MKYKQATIVSLETSLSVNWIDLVQWYAFTYKFPEKEALTESDMRVAEAELEDFRGCRGSKSLGFMSPVVNAGSVVGQDKNSHQTLTESKQLSSEIYYLLDPRMTTGLALQRSKAQLARG